MRKLTLGVAVASAALALAACGQEVNEAAADATGSDVQMRTADSHLANDTQPLTLAAVEARAARAYRNTLPEEERKQATRDRFAELKARQN